MSMKYKCFVINSSLIQKEMLIMFKVKMRAVVICQEGDNLDSERKLVTFSTFSFQNVIRKNMAIINQSYIRKV